MSAFKKMPNEKPMRIWRYSVWFFVIAVLLALICVKRFGGASGSSLSDILSTVLVIGIVSAFIVEQYNTSHQRCPDCGKSMREIHEDIDPSARDYHLLYCECCDTVWDKSVPKSSG